ncbi:MAG: S-layer homology domain-containing protein [Oscillospiraceae bacterium]|nr:S-layer homology domain-containing protein [Oscillospiraceae bacterium]
MAMKRSLARTAALIMAVMMTGTSVPAYVSAESGGTVSTESNESDKALREALTIVKKRVDIPAEMSEFYYSNAEEYGTKAFNLTWHTPDDVKAYKQLDISIVGNIIVSYEPYDYGDKSEENGFGFAKLSEKELLKKAKEHLKRLNPSIGDNARLELGHVSLYSNSASVTIERYETGVPVKDNYGKMYLDKNTGELQYFSLAWADNAKFADSKNARTVAEIQEDFKKLCKLTPYYVINKNWQTGEVYARIVYNPDFYSEIDAFTGKKSTIWEDMYKAGGKKLSSILYGITDDDYDDASSYAGAADDGDDSMFTEEELKKIQQEESLLTKEQVFELLKKDKIVALTDDYEVSSYAVSSRKEYPMVLDNARGVAYPDKSREEENFYVSATYKVKDAVKDKFKGYKTVYVYLNAGTGEIISMEKWGLNGDRPKLDVKKASAAAAEAAKAFDGDIFGEYKANEGNSAPVKVWTNTVTAKDGQTVETEHYETSRTFGYARYVNGIQVDGDGIYVEVDGNGVVTEYSSTYTEAVFPSADILTPDQALDKLYTQQDFHYYYDGWVGKDGAVHTYLIYRTDSFYLNAKTGQICSWSGVPVKKDEKSDDEVKYTDIKGIPQEKAILMLQKYNIVLTKDSKFDPTGDITEYEFRNLLIKALDLEANDIDIDKNVMKETALTREGAAVIFTRCYDTGGITNIRGIFKTPYSDVKSSDKNAGAITVAYSYGFFDKGDGKFYGSRKITRAEAMQMIYDHILLLSSQSK